MAKFRDDIPDGGSGHYLKLKDKESAYVICIGDPAEFFIKWEQGKSTEVPEGTEGAKFRFRINAVVKEGNEYVVKIWEQGPVVYRLLSEINKEYGDLSNVILKVTRKGSGLDTEYTVMPIKQEVTKEAKAKIAKLKPHDLHKRTSDTEAPAFDEPFPTQQFEPSADELPF